MGIARMGISIARMGNDVLDCCFILGDVFIFWLDNKSFIDFKINVLDDVD